MKKFIVNAIPAIITVSISLISIVLCLGVASLPIVMALVFRIYWLLSLVVISVPLGLTALLPIMIIATKEEEYDSDY